MVLVSKETFLDMFEKGVLIGSDKYKKDWTITSKNKNSKGKTYYVGDGSWSKYCKVLRSNSK